MDLYISYSTPLYWYCYYKKNIQSIEINTSSYYVPYYNTIFYKYMTRDIESNSSKQPCFNIRNPLTKKVKRKIYVL